MFVVMDLDKMGAGEEGAHIRTAQLFEALDFIGNKEPWVAKFLADPRNTTHLGGINLLEE
jgi:hypothetical protein